MTQISPRRCFDWAVKVASSALYIHTYMCQFNAPDVSTRLRLESCGPLEIMPREPLECAQPPPPRPHSSRATTNNPRCQVQQALQPGRATWAIGSLDSGLAQGSGRGRVFNQIKAVSCVLRSFYLAKLFGLSQIHSSCPAPSTAPCSLLPACLPAACPGSFPESVIQSVSQSGGLSVGRSFSYASQNCLQLGIPYTYSHF